MLRSLILITLASIATGQTPRPFVNATGTASVSVAADQISVILTVTSRAATAQEATSQNATKVSNLLVVLRKLLGSTGDIKTLNVNVNPVSGPPPQNQIVAYNANSSLQVTVTQANVAGTVIDTATQNGASNVGALQFGLKDPEPSRAQALRLATQQAKAHAEAMAFALGRTLGSVTSVTEAAGNAPRAAFAVGAIAVTATPIEAGPLEVSATVVLTAELN